MTEDDAQDIELSERSSEVTHEGITVQVGIYRTAGSSEGWTLEVIDEDDNSLIWEDSFATDAEAWEEFERAVAEDGIAQLIGPATDELN